MSSIIFALTLLTYIVVSFNLFDSKVKTISHNVIVTFILSIIYLNRDFSFIDITATLFIVLVSHQNVFAQNKELAYYSFNVIYWLYPVVSSGLLQKT